MKKVIWHICPAVKGTYSWYAPRKFSYFWALAHSLGPEEHSSARRTGDVPSNSSSRHPSPTTLVARRRSNGFTNHQIIRERTTRAPIALKLILMRTVIFNNHTTYGYFNAVLILRFSTNILLLLINYCTPPIIVTFFLLNVIHIMFERNSKISANFDTNSGLI